MIFSGAPQVHTLRLRGLCGARRHVCIPSRTQMKPPLPRFTRRPRSSTLYFYRMRIVRRGGHSSELRAGLSTIPAHAATLELRVFTAASISSTGSTEPVSSR